MAAYGKLMVVSTHISDGTNIIFGDLDYSLHLLKHNGQGFSS